jgi:hypothetical protein
MGIIIRTGGSFAEPILKHDPNWSPRLTHEIASVEHHRTRGSRGSGSCLLSTFDLASASDGDYYSCLGCPFYSLDGSFGNSFLYN